MNELQVKTELTPIEIALGVDEQGRTTARKLYEFLGLAKSQFSRWCRTNILDNEFAEEGIDYEGFDINVEGNAVKDYRLSASFAKKLSMTAKNERGEQAREYFVRAEDKLKQIAIQASTVPTDLLILQGMLNKLIQQEMAINEIKSQSQKAIETTKAIKDAIVEEYDEWREDIRHKVSAIQKATGETFANTWNRLYDELEKRAHCDLSVRVNNGRFRLQEAGAPKKVIEAFGRLDVIENDVRLKEIFTAIVKEYTVKYVA